MTIEWRKTIENAAAKARRLESVHARRGYLQQAADYAEQARGLDESLRTMGTES